MLAGDLRSLNQVLREPVEYTLELAELTQPLNAWIGARVHIAHTGVKRCVACGRQVNKLFQNGYCFPCVRSLAECDLCIVKPHECHFHLGTCRDESWAQDHCMIPHYVYLAWSSGYKVGLTRKGRELKRWMDQGATEAMVIAEVPTRRIAGELEMEIAKYMADKTDWRKMLREDTVPDRSLKEVLLDVLDKLNPDYHQYLVEEKWMPQTIHYPRTPEFTVNLKSMNLDKSPEVTGTLRGIKGQYLLFDEGVLNIKKYAGYHVEISANVPVEA
ncbi:hypothetical protein AAC03nite_15040 [Alicyclobacillus acidoterrestris]|nr:hypothetical protein AAC03nite_15040 [Alicyclobacillus acidoterrestris]